MFSFLVKKLLENLKTVNNQNQIVFREVRRITLVSTLNVQTLDPFIISKMNNISNELKVGSWHCVKKVLLQNFTICTFPSLCWQLPINLCAAQKKECAEPYHDDQAFYLRNTHQRRFKSSLKHQWWSFYSKIVNGFQSLSISTKEHHLRYQKKFVKQLLPASAVLQSYSWSSVKEKSATKSIRGKEKQHFRFSIAQRRSFHKADTQTKICWG